MNGTKQGFEAKMKDRTDQEPEPKNRTIVYRRTGMDELADLLLAELHEEIVRSGDVFRRIRVIVPNRSIERYLSLRFADRYGIFAQIEFASQMSVFRRFMPRNTQVRINEKTIAWRVYRILLEPESEGVFPGLVRWIGGDAQKLYELSRQLGSLYDKYMLYRPEWITAWEAGRPSHGAEGEAAAVWNWQGELWRRIAREDWKGNHFAAVYDRIRNGKDVQPNAVSGADSREPETIRIFGFSQLPPAVLECLTHFGPGTTVKLYHLVPSRYFLGDLRDQAGELKKLKDYLEEHFADDQDSGEIPAYIVDLYSQHNPLTASFAMQSLILLNGTENWEGDTGYDYDGADEPEEETGTVLHRLQDRIRRDAGPCRTLAPDLPEGSGCRSVQIRSCYSAFREVEAAHNFILHCLDEDPSLSMKDIFIMTPSPSEYAPLVDAVFNHAHDAARSKSGKELRLGVSVADRPRTERLPSYSTLLKTLSLFKGDFTTSDVFGILQDQEIQNQWGITPNDFQYCLSAAMRAGIRWGWDAESREESGETAFQENSWRAGFDRMLLNYAVDADPAAPCPIGTDGDEVIFPVPGFEDGRAGLLGKFIALTSKLHGIAQFMRGRERTGMEFREWETVLADWAGYLFGQDSELKILLLSVLSVWRQELENADAEDVPLTSGIVLAYLQDKHVRPEDNTLGFLRGRITFCGLRPMRSIPAGAIVLLGMNHGAFPEQDDKRDFDLMQLPRGKNTGKPDSGRGFPAGIGTRSGDPVRRDESRQLFLDTVMAARDYLYISYVGMDIHDRKEKPPSACVEELKSYLTQEFGKNSFIAIQEPIHAFSTELFRPGAVNQSYSATLLTAAEQTVNRAAPEARPLFDIREGIGDAESVQADNSLERVGLQDLKDFFFNPAETYLSKGLDANVSVSKATLPEDSEPFEGQMELSTKRELFRSYRETDDGNRAALKHESLLRLKANGAVSLMQDEENWDDWDDIVKLGRGIESIPQNGAEAIPAAEVPFIYSMSDAGMPAALVCPEPEGGFRTTLILPETRVYPPESDEPGSPRIQIVSSFAGRISGSSLISPVLDHLRANLARRTLTRLVYLGTAQNAAVMEFDPMEQADAENAFRRLLCLYRAGLRKPLPFFPKTSYRYAENQDESSAENEWNGYNATDAGEFGRYFGNELVIDDSFRYAANTFFKAVNFRGIPQRGRKAKPDTAGGKRK